MFLELDSPIQRQLTTLIPLVDLVLCALETAATCSRYFAKGVLKIPLATVKGLDENALLVSEQSQHWVTLLFSSIELKICPATSMVQFPKS